MGSKFEDQPLGSFLTQLASGSPTPGGGGAAALMGAMGAALVSMVCHLTLGKKKYAAVETEIQALLEPAEELCQRLAGMIEADKTAFDRVMQAYGLPKSTPEEKDARAQAIEAALKEATQVPMDCVTACAEVIELCKTAAESGNRNVVSDAGAGVLAAYAGLTSAALNVYVNVGGLKDRAFAEARLAELNRILDSASISSEEIHRCVKLRLLGES